MIWYDMIWSDIMGERWDERKKERQKGEEEDRSEIERKRWRLWHELADDSDAIAVSKDSDAAAGQQPVYRPKPRGGGARVTYTNDIIHIYLII
jgi:hypothetical protein